MVSSQSYEEEHSRRRGQQIKSLRHEQALPILGTKRRIVWLENARVAGVFVEKVFRQQFIPDVVCHVKELNDVTYEHSRGDTICNFCLSSSAFV